MDLLDILKRRRSVRAYTGQEVDKKMLETILQAGMLSPSSRAIRPWELIAVTQKEMLQELAGCRVGAARTLETAGAAVVVIADAQKSDVWVEDSAAVMTQMHLMADHLGLGSCWIQGRLRQASNGKTTEDYVQKLLGFPDNYRLEGILALGVIKTHPEPYRLSQLPTEKIHWERF